LQVQPYRPELADAWNALNRAAAGGHFMFDRGFMDYHADRFEDASLMVLRDGTPAALLPLNRRGDEAWSHQGLTFGGLVSHGLGVTDVMAALDACADHLRGQGVGRLTYKALPWIYAREPAQADLYWLFRRGAALVRRDVSAAIDYRARGRVSSRRARGARKAAQAGLAFARSEDWGGYWALLEEVLGGRHGAKPVHSEAEIRLLAGRFPENISLHTAVLDGRLMAGVVMFRSAQVAHAQYIAAGEEGRGLGALDGLFEHLIQAHAATHRWFDFGVSNTDQGRVLNEGLIRQKEEFGAGAVVHDFYAVALG
jgi:hypothetical protein